MARHTARAIRDRELEDSLCDVHANAMTLLQTDSIRELAEFWHTHDVDGFADELEEVGERVRTPACQRH